MDPNNTVINDRVQGLGYVGNTTGTLSVASFTFFSGETRTFSTTIPHAHQEALSANQVRFSGVGNPALNNKWSVMGGSMFFRNTSPSYDVVVVVTRTGIGQLLTVVFKNPTVASNQTVPNITIDIKSYYYAPSWV